jgi:hypothetical protein
MNLAILLLCSGLAFGQSTGSGEPPAESVDLKPTHGCRGNLGIGVTVKQSWNLAPSTIQPSEVLIVGCGSANF